MSITRSNEADLKKMFPGIAEDFKFPVHEKPVMQPE